MTNKTIHKPLQPPKLRRARSGSKRGWPTVTGQVAPEVYVRFEALSQSENRWSSDLVAEAIELLLDKKAA